MSSQLKQYLVVTASYWSFTLTDGALRMLVVLYFHQLGYSPLQVAMLFVFYEFFGVLTNLFGGWLATRTSLNLTLKLGLSLQILALSMLTVPAEYLGVVYVMTAQAFSGIAKDLSKMSAKTQIKFLIPADQDSQLYSWVAKLTGSKNAMKGIGFFMGGALLHLLGFQGALWSLATLIVLVLIGAQLSLAATSEQPTFKPKFKDLFSKSEAINKLSLARFFLFGARDVWFVVALPVYLQSILGWSHVSVGTFLASWIILYGVVQANAPKVTNRFDIKRFHPAAFWLIPLTFSTLVTTIIGTFYGLGGYTIVITLLIFGFFFAINSSLHSYLAVSFAEKESAALDVGFYYMSNAAGRLAGTVFSGLIYQTHGLSACLAASTVCLLLATLVSQKLRHAHV